MADDPHGFFECLQGDTQQSGWRVWPTLLVKRGAFVVFIYRLSSLLYHKGRAGWALSMLLFRFNTFVNKCEIWPTAIIGPGFHLMHPMGVVIARVRIGANVKVYQGVTMGQRSHNDEASGYPSVGENTCVYAGAVIAGGVTVGKNCHIGANTVVTIDIPDNAKVVPAKPRIILGDSPQ